MGLSVAKDELYYIYVLRVEGNGWYVGSTQSFERRMRSHFGKGGAVATKERRALDYFRDVGFTIINKLIKSVTNYFKSVLIKNNLAFYYLN